MIPSVATVAPDTIVPTGGDDVEAGLFAIVRKYLKTPNAAWDATTTMAEAEIDSLDLVEVIFDIEDRFGVEVDFNANAKPAAETTFGDVVALIRSALAAKARRA